MFKNLVLAYDGSEFSLRALQRAKAIAERFESTLWLVHVFRNPSDFLGYTDFEKLFAKRKSAAQAVLDDEVHLGAIESGIAFLDVILASRPLFQHAAPFEGVQK